jgi:hypothetical protein
MTDTADERKPISGETRDWRNQVPVLLAGAVISGIIAMTLAFGGRIVQTTSTADVLVAKVERVEKQNDTQEVLLREMLKTQATAYTREEARADREAAERRFQRLEGSIGDIARRVEALETGQRLMQQLVLEKGNPVRH